MTARTGLLWLLPISVGIACLLVVWPFPDGIAAHQDANDTPTGRGFRLVGSNSCSGRGCHGNLEPQPGEKPSQAEYSIWCLQDPHSRAYRVLFNERSGTMVQRLGLAKASEEPRCLACHTTPQAVDREAPLKSEWEFGVGCEACHGSAEKWLKPHVDKVAWPKRKHELKLAGIETTYGMKDLSNLAHRTSVCTGCHIGAPADPKNGIPLRDMNHDMIAAGHPRLLFEMGSYLANLPRHWEEKNSGPAQEAQQWAVGQVASLEASLALLSDRAKNPDRPWPEFAQHDCYACHHDLANPSWRLNNPIPQRKPGTIPHSTWYSAMPRLLAQESNQPVKAFNALDDILNQRSPNRDQADKAAKELHLLLGPLADELSTRPWKEDARQSLRTQLARHGQADGLRSWDEACQSCFALAALGCNLKGPLGDLINGLALPSFYDSPRRYRRELTVDDLRSLFKRLEEQ